MFTFYFDILNVLFLGIHIITVGLPAILDRSELLAISSYPKAINTIEDNDEKSSLAKVIKVTDDIVNGMCCMSSKNLLVLHINSLKFPRYLYILKTIWYFLILDGCSLKINECGKGN